ncbi:MAG: hypothetical protein GXP26_08160 [Planctomycetes bacterium]|nr:hypothetical protein [Planctomycetota bacterium]
MKTSVALLVAAALWLGSAADVQAHTPYVTYFHPVPHAVYYAPAPVVYQPVARVHTRFRPILGGRVTRVRYGYAPAYYAPPVVYAY